jgi:hypothetical protein
MKQLLQMQKLAGLILTNTDKGKGVDGGKTLHQFRTELATHWI